MTGRGLEKRRLIVPRRRCEYGFSLLELAIAMFILVLLISIAVPTYRNSVQHAREVVLQENLFQMRRAIDQYSADKERLPQSLQDLVESNYFREIPVDPMTDEREWNEIIGEDPNSADAEQGLVDVKSLAEGQDSNGKKYSDF